MGQKEMAARCCPHTLEQIKKILPQHKCSNDRDAKPIDVDLLNCYCIEIGGNALFCSTTPVLVCNTIHKAVNKKMGMIDMRRFDEQLEREAVEEE